ncbi:hypothetical protein [Streptomyces sp. NPDC051000]|uniref:hypothetical protein n=1 Tax=Streptomyces sp. NPDC051000 TaxID=3155520 RepID=UPI0033C2A5E3
MTEDVHGKRSGDECPHLPTGTQRAGRGTEWSVHGADEQKLTDVRSLIEQGTWAAPVIRLTGEVRHGSWSLQKDAAHRYDESTVQNAAPRCRSLPQCASDASSDEIPGHRALWFGVSRPGFKP